MAGTWRRVVLFGGGIVVGVLAGMAGVVGMHGGDGPYTSSPAPARATGAPAAQLAAFATAVAGNCDLTPMLAKTGAADGSTALQPKPAHASGDEIGRLILSGKEAAASGRQRDAEVEFLNACHAATALDRPDAIPLADAMYQLARHYANAAAFGAAHAPQLFERAERLYSASLAAYTARYGPSHEKTRFAQEGLITVQQATGHAPPHAMARAPAAPAPATGTATATAPVRAQVPGAGTAAGPTAAASGTAPQNATGAPQAPSPAAADTAVATTAPSAAPPAAESRPPQPRRTEPSFNCAQAHSATEKLICGDEELARMDRELGQLHQRAKAASQDPRAFQRQSDAEWQKREATCADRDCLYRWYAQRRQELAAAAAQPQARAGARAQQEARVRPQGDQRQHPRRPAPIVTDAEAPAPAGAGASGRPAPPATSSLGGPASHAERPVTAPVAPRDDVGTASGSPGTASGSAGEVPAAEGGGDGR